MSGRSPQTLVAQLLCLAGFGLFVEYSWMELIDEQSMKRGLAAVAISLVLALALVGLGRVTSTAKRRLGSALCLVVGLGALTVSAGVPARLLEPGNWLELADGFSSGLRGASHVTLPYAGAGEWVRISILLVPALMLGLATALAFWPGRVPRPRRRTYALVVLVVAYAIAAAWYTPGAQLGRGLALTVLICAWLWLPGLDRRPLAIAVASILAAGLLALPVAAATKREEALLDYRNWSPLGGDGGVRFQWTPSYGPFTYQQRGTEMLRVTSTRALYWKAEVLDSFDGIGWKRSSSSVLDAVERGPAQRALAGIPQGALREHPDWVEDVDVSVEQLRSRRLIGSGVPVQIDGVRTLKPDADGTTFTRGDPLREGDSYSFKTYSPQPTTLQLDKSGTDYPAGIDRFTSMVIPFDGIPPPIQGVPPRDSLTEVVVPPAADQADLAQEQKILSGSEYSEMLSLTRQITADQRTPYAKVVAIQDYLRKNFRYEQKVPEREFPLPAFIGLDKAGYCQQFSGAMALMLRMVGVPSRVSTGFSTGEINGESNRFIVRDLNAHSWVEAYFPKIGWITFDPTPPVAPAVKTYNASGPTEFIGIGDLGKSGDSAKQANGKKGDGEKPGFEGAAISPPGDDDSGVPLWPALLIPLGGAVAWREVRRRRLTGDDPVPQLVELSRVDSKLGAASGRNSTLLEVERRLSRIGGPAAGRYAAALREHRYGAKPAPRPGSHERRALRKALARRGGPVGRWGAWRLLPPGGPPGSGSR